MNFYDRVREKAGEKYDSLQEFFISIEISPSSFYTWEERKNLPRADEAYKIAQALGTTVEYLVAGKNPIAVEETFGKIEAAIKQHRKAQNNGKNPPNLPIK